MFLKHILRSFFACFKSNLFSNRTSSFVASLIFYTAIPFDRLLGLKPNFNRIARFAPMVGLILGGLLGGIDSIFALFGIDLLLRSALIVCLWIGLTGGLHLDGAMDTADGWGVSDPEKRLTVMADSRSGAFGVMAALTIVLLKTTSLAALTDHRWLSLCFVAGWSRWSQVIAIARYPYLKATGKGAFHKQQFHNPQDWILGLGILLFFHLGQSLLRAYVPDYLWSQGVGDWKQNLLEITIALGLSVWIPSRFYYQFGGHTGDTYGAVVEWAETLLLIGSVSLENFSFKCGFQ
jgi:adenosylcobinamide-GDP ribazoletransferase